MLAKQLELVVGYICIACIACYVILYHTTVSRVNRELPPSERIEHGLLAPSLRGRIAGEYRKLFPTGNVLMLGRIARFGILVSFFAWILIRGYEYWAGH